MTTPAVLSPPRPGQPRVLKSARPTRFRMFLYGDTKLGKSTAAAACHSAEGRNLVIPWATRGYEALADTQLLIREDETPYEHGKLIDLLPTLDLKQYDCVVIDDVQGLLDGVFDEVAARYDKPAFDEVESPGKWPALFDRFFDVINDVARRTRNLIVVSREKYERTTDREIARILPDVPPGLWKKMEGDFDFVGHARPGTPQPGNARPRSVVTFQPGGKIVAGQRWPVFPGPVELDGRAIYDTFVGWATRPEKESK